ncbi:hypothetical protein DFR76_10252 [Nocardia pseudobrasiliensis]|uniref:Uncharacterized protein n=1 Tax=Nocardia pseudobrasiliensis TaxID=45979 RepID=A0A370IAB6_9NOCA|nr:hypothetical protein DFR76_10252 [Nocardia pseudobrasiliensis]
MGKCQPVLPVSRPRRLLTGAVAGALPLLVVAAAGGSAAATLPLDETTPIAFESAAAIAPAASAPIGAAPVGTTALEATSPGPASADSAPVDTNPADSAASVDPAVVERNSPAGMRLEPPRAPLAGVEVEALHLPDPTRLATVAPIQAPAGKLRFGDTRVDIPGWLPPEAATTVNDVSAQAEAQLASTLDAAGFAPSRSDRIAAETLGTAAVGAAVGAAAASPLAVAGAVIGGVAGTLAGMPMLPLGTPVVTALGATAGAAMITVPAAVVGAAIGAGVGAASGYLAPAVDAAAPDPGVAIVE